MYKRRKHYVFLTYYALFTGNLLRAAAPAVGGY